MIRAAFDERLDLNKGLKHLKAGGGIGRPGCPNILITADLILLVLTLHYEH